MKQLIPRFIDDQYRRRLLHGRFEAVVVSMDIVGFTTMTQRLMELGRAGAEIVTAIINEVFGPCSELIYGHGGWIGKFVGDQVVAFFLDEAGPGAYRAAAAIQELFVRRSACDTPVGSMRLSARIGIARGAVSWGIVRAAPRDIFYFRGSALARCMSALARCKPGAIACHRSAASRPECGDTVVDPSDSPLLDPALLCRFVPSSVLEMEDAGEFRDIACLFLSFRPEDGRLSHGFLQRFVPLLVEEAERFQGFLSELDFGDKGSVALLYFGAPQGLEHPVLHAGGFALAVRERTAGVARVRVGIAHGKVFAGFVGSSLRCEYKAVGSVVNLAARLMGSAAGGCILLDGRMAPAAPGFVLTPVPPLTLKGFPDAVPAFELTGRTDAPHDTRSDLPLIGRRDELAALWRLLSPLKQGEFCGIVYVDGKAGIGKSRLVQELRTEASSAGVAWFSMPSDEILRQSLNPLRCFARSYFGCTAEHPKERHEANFATRLDALMARADPESCQELERLRSVFGAAVDLFWAGSLYDQLDPRSRKEQTFRAFKLLFRVEAGPCPVIIELEDCQWADADTAEFLRALTQNMGGHPIALIALARTGDDEAPYRFTLEGVPSGCVLLRHLSETDTAALAERLLGGAPSRPLLEVLENRSEGNPFYLEQLVRFMQETGVVGAHDGQSHLTSQIQDLPETISAVIVARIDRLARELREAVKRAAVLGREFNVPVLSAMLHHSRAATLLEAGRREAVWGPLSDLIFIFRHALIRETAYQMQLQETVRRLHLLAGEAIEDLYRDDLMPHVGALAHHFDKAGDFARAEPYLWKAAEAAEARWGNEEALGCYTRLEAYVCDLTGQIEICRRKGILLDRLGRLEEAERVMEAYLAKSSLSGESARVLDSMNALGNVILRRGRADDALRRYREALRIATETGDLKGMSAAVNNIGRVHRLQGRFDEAMGCFRQDLRISWRRRDQKSIGYTLGNMGSIYGSLGDLRRARRCFGTALKIAEELGDKFSIALSAGSIGLACMLEGNLEEARRLFIRQKTVAEETGDQYNIGYAAGNLGEVLHRQGDLDGALRHYERKLAISREMGYRYGEGIALDSLGRAHEDRGESVTAIGFLDEAVAIARELGSGDYLCGYLNHRVNAELSASSDLSAEKVMLLERMAGEAAEIADRIGKTEEAMAARVNQARLIAARGDSGIAAEHLRQILPHATGLARARVLHALFDITGSEAHRAEALVAYRQIEAQRSGLAVRRQISMLKGGGSGPTSP
ncbi:tetratricopeptide repeat protein [Candidatus Fermentibacteria bacterium]|nr:tetratricopeptide repeat protein [Candidatus Fermentibacteria bacterium]